MSVVGTGREGGGLQERVSVFNVFAHIFAYFPHFTIFSCAERTKIFPAIRGNYTQG